MGAQKIKKTERVIADDAVAESIQRLSTELGRISDPAVRAFVKAVMMKAAQLKAEQTTINGGGNGRRI